MSGPEALQRVRWTPGDDGDVLFEAQYNLGVFSQALSDCCVVYANPNSDTPYSMVEMLQEWAEFENIMESLGQEVCDLHNCIAWPPSHHYHVQFSPAMWSFQRMKSAAEKIVSKITGYIAAYEMSLKRLETASFAYETGKALVTVDGSVVVAPAEADETEF